jgi:chromosome segregation ATPase
VSELEKQSETSERRVRTPRGRRIAIAAIAACLIVGVSASLLHLRTVNEGRARIADASVRFQLAVALAARKTIDEKVASLTDRLSHLQTENSILHRESGHLRERLQATLQELDRERAHQADQLNALQEQQSSAGEQVRALTEERDRLSSQLQGALMAAQRTESQLVALRDDRGRSTQYQTDLAARVREL